MDINLDQIRALADLAIEKSLAELEVKDGAQSVSIKLPGYQGQQVIHTASYPSSPTVSSHLPQTVYTPAAPPPMGELPAVSSRYQEPSQADADASLYSVTAPMVGTFYSAPSPDSPAYVQTGQLIAKGQVVCIIEAMKMMNELESETSGKVVRILVENGQPVEFGQPLFLVEPA
jgi:acetyl-CoA carboxylase biotin carboxyl carrier protein